MANYALQKEIKLGHLGDIVYHKSDDGAWLQPLKWDPIKEAMRVLNGNAFKLWIYLFSWEGNGKYDFSPANLAKELKMSDEGARNARKELVEKGYIIENSENKMEFFPISRTTISQKI